MADHTPGPWTLETVETACGICHKIGPFPWREGKPNHACVYVDSNHWESADELFANARLIAAAPELLEALDAVLGEYSDLQSDTFGMPDDDTTAIQMARIATAKVKGDD